MAKGKQDIILGSVLRCIFRVIPIRGNPPRGFLAVLRGNVNLG